MAQLSKKQKEQLEELVFLTIIPSLFEDLGIDDEVEEQEALEYLVKEIQENYLV